MRQNKVGVPTKALALTKKARTHTSQTCSRVNICAPKHEHSRSHTWADTHMHPHIQIQMKTTLCTDMIGYVHTHIHTHAHIQTHTHIHMHTHRHTYTHGHTHTPAHAPQNPAARCTTAACVHVLLMKMHCCWKRQTPSAGLPSLLRLCTYVCTRV
jgi:hypothetical protein